MRPNITVELRVFGRSYSAHFCVYLGLKPEPWFSGLMVKLFANKHVLVCGPREHLIAQFIAPLYSQLPMLRCMPDMGNYLKLGCYVDWVIQHISPYLKMVDRNGQYLKMTCSSIRALIYIFLKDSELSKSLRQTL